MFTCIRIFAIALFSLEFASLAKTSGANVTTCKEFEVGARFNPYEIVDSMWKIVYFWANATELYPIIFSPAANKSVARYKEVFEAMSPDIQVDWSKATFFMSPRPGIQVLFFYMGTPSVFRALVKKEQRYKVRPYPGPSMKITEIRMKLIHRAIVMMCCEDLSAYVLLRMFDVCKTEEKCQQIADSANIKSPYTGQSYLSLQESLRDMEEL